MGCKGSQFEYFLCLISSIFGKSFLIFNNQVRPEITATGEASNLFEKHKVQKVHLSISHEEEYAIANVLIEQN